MKNRLLLVGLLLMASMALLLVAVPALAQPDPMPPAEGIVFATATPPADEAGIPVEATAAPEGDEESEPAATAAPAGDALTGEGDDESEPLPVDDVPMVSAEIVNLLFDRWSQTNNLSYFGLMLVVIVFGFGLYRSSPPETKASIKREVSAGAGSFLRRLSETDLVPGTSIDEELFDWLYQKYEAKRNAEAAAHAQAVGRAGTVTSKPITPVMYTPSGSPLYPPTATGTAEDHELIGKFG